MRIAVISPFGGGTVYGGPAVFLNRLLEPLAAEHDITVVYGRRAPSDIGFAWAAKSISLMQFGTYGALEQLTWALRASGWLWRHARHYDVVHLRGAPFFNLICAAAAIARRRRYVVVALNAGGELAPSGRTARLPGVAGVRRTLIRRSAVGFALSDGIAQELRQLGLAAARIGRIYNPVDTVLYAPPVGRPDGRSRTRAIGSVGLVGQRKRSELLLDVLTVLRSTGWPARLVVVGPFESPAYGRRFRSRMRELDLDDAVELVGYTDRVAPIMNTDISVLVNPSSQEGMPGALAEAMASGLPAVVTDVGAMGDVVRSAKAGYVVPPDAQCIARAVAELWADPDLWATHSQQARAFAVGNFDGAQVGASYAGALRAAVSESA